MENITTLKTPLGKDLELKSKLTARDRNILRGVFLSQMTFNPETKHVGDVQGSLLEEGEKKYIEIVVLKYDGSAENIYDRLLNADPEEYDFVVSETSKIGKLTFPTAK